MKRIVICSFFFFVIFATCTAPQADFPDQRMEEPLFHASFEQLEESTRVFVNESRSLRWTADDRISIFNRMTVNQQYRFTGNTGDESGGFAKVEDSNYEFLTGDAISDIVSVFPYRSSTAVSKDESLSLVMPAEQFYAKKTFGIEANTMVSVSSDNMLQYKNVGGYLIIHLYGEASVSEITLRGNNGEKLAGKMSVVMPLNGVPKVTAYEDASTEITLKCPSPVTLGVTAQECTEFWFVVPPVSFSKGFSISVKDDRGHVVRKVTSNNISVERNHLTKMAPVEMNFGLVAKERSDWSIRYIDREDWTNDDGNIERVEHLHFNYTGDGYFYVRTISPNDFYNLYEGNPIDFFVFETDYLLEEGWENGNDFQELAKELFSRTDTDAYFNRIRSGTWLAFMIELDGNGNVTGNYAKTSFTLQQEVPTDAFMKWIGSWKASNNNVSYTLNISSIDNNFIYRIDGWECGPNVSCQMNLEYIEGEFWAPNGALYFVSQDVGSYDDDNLGMVDECFHGSVLFSGRSYHVIDAGLDLAILTQNGNTVEIQPLDVNVTIEGSSHTLKFYSMQYFYRARSDGKWFSYNKTVTNLPLVLSRVPETKTEVILPSVQRTPTRLSVHRAQPEKHSACRRSSRQGSETVRAKMIPLSEAI